MILNCVGVIGFILVHACNKSAVFHEVVVVIGEKLLDLGKVWVVSVNDSVALENL